MGILGIVFDIGSDTFGNPSDTVVMQYCGVSRGFFFLKETLLHILSKTWPLVIAWNLTIGTIIIETHPLFYFLSFVPYFFSAQNMDHLLLFMDLSLEWLFLSFEFRKISQPSGQNILLSWGHKLELKFSRVTFSDAFWED